MAVGRILDLRTSFEDTTHPSRRVRLTNEQVQQLLTAATTDDDLTDSVDDTVITDDEAVVLSQVLDAFDMTRASRRDLRQAISGSLERADAAARAAQAAAFTATPARAGAVHAGGDLPADVDLMLSGLPVTSFAMPETSYAPISAAAERLVVDRRHPDATDPSAPMGLRVIPMSRADASRLLARTGLVQTGDVLLTVRPEWAGSGAYAEAQMGISHAGFASVRAGRALNTDMPLTEEYVGSLDAPHYRDASMLHIMRPRGITETQRTNLRNWISLLRERMHEIFPARLSFNSDYSAPAASSDPSLGFVERLGRLALGLPVDGMTKMYCSEFVWSLLALRDIDPTSPAVRRGDLSGISPLFNPAPLLGTATHDPDEHRGTAGLADGPALAADVATTDEATRDEMITRMFRDADPTRMSSGHRAMAAAMDPMFSELKHYLLNADDAAVAGPALDAVMDGANAAMQANYSPAYYYTNALLPEDERTFDYVGTIVFTD